jgi:hypothetical protein
MNKLFDILNSKTIYDSNPNRCALQKNNHVKDTILELLNYLKQVKPMTKQKVYCIEGYIQFLTGILQLAESIWTEYEKEGVYFLILSRFNQDALENLFASIREWCGPNSNPSVFTFSQILAKILCIKLINTQSDGANCEADEAYFSPEVLRDLVEFGNFENSQNVSTDNDISISEENEMIEIISDTEQFLTSDVIDLNSMRYVCGYVAYKVIKKFNCEMCKSTMVKDDDGEMSLTSEQFLLNKNYVTWSNNFHLKDPTDRFFLINQIHISVFEDYFKNNSHNKNLKKEIISLCHAKTASNSELNEWFLPDNSCADHRNYALDFLILILLRKNVTWTKDQMIKSMDTKRTKKRSTTKDVSSKKLKIIKK